MCIRDRAWTVPPGRPAPAVAPWYVRCVPPRPDDVWYQNAGPLPSRGRTYRDVVGHHGLGWRVYVSSSSFPSSCTSQQNSSRLTWDGLCHRYGHHDGTRSTWHPSWQRLPRLRPGSSRGRAEGQLLTSIASPLSPGSGGRRNDRRRRPDRRAPPRCAAAGCTWRRARHGPGLQT